jgi:hypothetical protein
MKTTSMYHSTSKCGTEGKLQYIIVYHFQAEPTKTMHWKLERKRAQILKT